MFSSRSRLAAALSATALLVAVAGCGDDGDAADAGAQAGTSSVFPVTVAHKYGSTEVKAEPKRVVVVGLVEQDALLAFGVVPVATTEWFGEYPGAIFPWAKDKLGSAAVPQVLKSADGIQFEKIAALKPDLIVGMYSDLKKEDYDKLTALAPTIAQPAGVNDYGVSWRDVTRTVGTALGKKAEADKLVADVDARFAKAKTEHPEFAGKTALMATPWEGIFVYGSQDPRSRLLADLGFTLPKDLDKVVGDKFGGNLSRERIDLLDVNALVWFVEPGKTRDLTVKDKLYAGLDVRKQGRDIFVDANNSDPFYGATSFVSVLSLPVMLDPLVAKLAAAVDGNPGTPVP
jgi:iron complex transport system substrate-binding protein